MTSFINRIFWKTVSVAAFTIILYVIYQWTYHDWSVDMILDFFTRSLRYLLPSLAIFYILYKSFIEKIILYIQRNKSAEIIAEQLNQINQISGAVRSGKDSSTVGASMIVKEYIRKKEKKELKKLKFELYIYDFKKINDWLNKNGKQFFVASEKMINQVFTKMLRDNQCFISDYWINKGINPKNHILSWKYKKDKYVPDIAYEDGITPGGQHFLDRLKKYVILYIYYNFIPNFIMSNQPILESFKVIKKNKRINRLFSKRLSQDYFKLKEETPIPFPKRGFVIETETAIFYSNIDSKNEKYVKDESGIREFYTTAGHLLREQVYIYGITQSSTRVMKALRELYPGYQHVFKMKFRATSNFTRRLIRFRIMIKKIRIARLQMFYYINSFTFSKIRYLIEHYLRIKLKKTKNIILKEKRYTKRIQKTKRRISHLYQKEAQKWANGYIIFYKGIYENISDVGKRVSFPLFGVIQESKKNTTTYQTFGFKQVNKIKDCFGRYDTHFMRTVREAKEIIYNMHFTDVPNWESFDVAFEDINDMNYSTFKQMMTVVVNLIEKKEKERKIRENKLLQERKNRPLPNLRNLEVDELINLCIDLDINQNMFDPSSSTYKADIIKAIADEYKLLRKGSD